jgi:hypothetical protein
MKTLMTIPIAVLAALSPCRLRAQSVPDFSHEVAISKLSTPVDFTKTVYAETSQAASAGFWLRIDMQSQSPDKAQRVFQLSGSESPKATYKITLDWKERTATVASKFFDKIREHAEESLDAYKITNLSPQNVCLLRVNDEGGVDVITMSSEIGSFMKTFTDAPGGWSKYQATTIWYGTCRN